MLYRFAPLLLSAVTVLMTGCANQIQQEQQYEMTADPEAVSAVAPSARAEPVEASLQGLRNVRGASVPVVVELRKSSTRVPSSPAVSGSVLAQEAGLMQRTQAVMTQLYQFPKQMVGGLIDRGFKLLGTPYRSGGSSAATGFDCSGFVSYLFREQGVQLPRSSREMIALDAPKVARHELRPGDILFFNDRGRGQVSHTGIYIGSNRFIHSSSHKSGGVRVDSLHDQYWNASYMQAKRVVRSGPDA